MESSLVNEIKKEIFLNKNASPSAYDTAWLAMIPDQEAPSGPMFKSCLTWILNNQKEDGFWGENIPTIYSLPATLACIIALKIWNVGESNITKGLKFVHAKTDILLKENSHQLPRWFIVVFPVMLQLAKEAGLEIVFVNGSKKLVAQVFRKRKAILESEKLMDETAGKEQPLLAYLGSNHEVLSNLCEDGSIFQSPSASAQAFMATGNQNCLEYLISVVHSCPNGVPSRFPGDEELIKLCMVDQIQRLGLAQHFNKEIDQILDQFYNNIQTGNQAEDLLSSLPERLYKDSLAFRLLRMQGYKINQGSFCWFLDDADIKAHIEKNHAKFIAVMYNVYRATDLMFTGESEMEEARSFSRNLLHNSITNNESPQLQTVIEHELNVPWSARLEHLDHRMWIELNQSLSHSTETPPLIHRLPFLQNDKLLQLAVENYEYRQSIYKKELEELKRWSKEKGLVDIGFGREKTMYSYFASAASSSSFLPIHSFIRLVVAKCSIIITIADDFYDMEAPLTELQILTEAIQRWDGRYLDGPSKIIFDALDDFVCDIAKLYLLEYEIDITPKLQHIWQETFLSWMTESKWSRTGAIPSMDEYLNTGMTSIAAHTIVLQAGILSNPCLPSECLKPVHGHYENITKLLMTTTRLLNDIQSYQKEKEEGKMNYVLLHMNQNPGAHIEDSIDFVQGKVDNMKKEFVEQVLMDGLNDMPRICKLLHLSCLKVFNMFFYTTNLFDSKAGLVDDIMKAIYTPLQHQTPEPSLKPLPISPPQEKKTKNNEMPKISACLNGITFKQQVGFGISFVRRQAPPSSPFLGSAKAFTSQKLRMCFT